MVSKVMSNAIRRNMGYKLPLFSPINVTVCLYRPAALAFVILIAALDIICSGVLGSGGSGLPGRRGSEGDDEKGEVVLKR